MQSTVTKIVEGKSTTLEGYRPLYRLHKDGKLAFYSIAIHASNKLEEVVVIGFKHVSKFETYYYCKSPSERKLFSWMYNLLRRELITGSDLEQNLSLETFAEYMNGLAIAATRYEARKALHEVDYGTLG